MTRMDYQLDTRVRRKHIPLFTQQRRLRHLRCIAARNIDVNTTTPSSTAVGLYFTLHQNMDSPEFYRSETVYECMNPSWRSFEASAFAEDVNSAASFVVVRLWFVTDESPPSLVTEWLVHFSGLMFLGNQVPKEGKKFKPNSLLFGMFEGFYGSRDCFQSSVVENSCSILQEEVPVEASSVRTSYCVNTLYRIQIVQQVIKQTQASVKKTRSALEEQLHKALDKRKKKAEKEMMQMQVDMLQSELNSRKAVIEAIKEQKAVLEEQIQDKGMELLSNYQQLSKEREQLKSKRKRLDETRETLLKKKAQLLLRRKQLITELAQIYPIVQFPDKNGYSIAGVHLPNAEDFAGHDDTMISVALGYVCHLLVMISRILNVPLRYPIRYFGSHSSICDQVISKVPDNNREFPLYSKGRDKTRFNYGVFLLNKNISQLRHYCSLSTEDLRKTLPNLHDLIETRLSIRSDQGNLYMPISISSPPLQPPGYPHPTANQPTVFTVPLPSEDSYSKRNDAVQNGLPVNSRNEENNDSKKNDDSYFSGDEIGRVGTSKKQYLREKPRMKFVSKTSSEATHSCLSCSLDKGLNDIKYMQQCMRVNANGDGSNAETRPRSRACNLAHRAHHSSVPNLAACVSPVILEDDPLSVTNARSVPVNHKMWTACSSQGNSDDEILTGICGSSPGVDGTALSYSPVDSTTSGEDLKSKDGEDEPVLVSLSECTDLKDTSFDMDLALRTERLASASGSFQMQKHSSSATIPVYSAE